MSFKQKDEVKIKRDSLHFIPFHRSKCIWCFLYINQSIAPTVHQQPSQVMNDLAGKEDASRACKTVLTFALSQIPAWGAGPALSTAP